MVEKDDRGWIGMKIKPKKVYENVYDAMSDCVQRFKDKDLIKDGDVIELDEDEAVTFDVIVKDDEDD